MIVSLSPPHFDRIQREALSSAKKDAGLQPVFVVTVDDPQKVGDPIRQYIMYTVHTRVSIVVSALLKLYLLNHQH